MNHLKISVKTLKIQYSKSSLCKKKRTFNSDFFVPPWGTGAKNSHDMTPGQGKKPRGPKAIISLILVIGRVCSFYVCWSP